MSRAASPLEEIEELVTVAPPARRGRAARAPAEHSLKARMAVMAPSIAEAVQFAGGWLADQALAGWEVSVLTAERGDPRPLRILGARAHNLEPVLASPSPDTLGQCLRAIVVSADLYDRDVRLRRLVRNAREAHSADVRMWCDTQQANRSQPGQRVVRHQPSLAAQAFKAHALAAADVGGAPFACAEVEVFSSLTVPVLSRKPRTRHLVPSETCDAD